MRTDSRLEGVGYIYVHKVPRAKSICVSVISTLLYVCLVLSLRMGAGRTKIHSPLGSLTHTRPVRGTKLQPGCRDQSLGSVDVGMLC